MLHHILSNALALDPDRPILESDGNWTTAAELERLATRLASGLQAMGLEEGDRVALLLPNCVETIVCYLACFRLHLVVVPIDYEYHPLQIGYALGHSGAAMLVVDHERMPGLEEAGVLAAVSRVAVVGDGSAAGRHRPFAALLGADRELPADAPNDDSPAVMVYTSGTTSRPKGVVLSHRALTPAGLAELVAHPEFATCDVSRLRLCLAGADLPTGVVGDLRVSGPGIMDGYWNETAMTRKTLQQGWVLTGDLGRYDEDGYLWFMGRRKDIIVYDGHKVSPLAVEAALAEHPAALQACVIGVPDADFDEYLQAAAREYAAHRQPSGGQTVSMPERAACRSEVRPP